MVNFKLCIYYYNLKRLKKKENKIFKDLSFKKIINYLT